MTNFEKLTQGMKFDEPTYKVKENMINFFNYHFNCPPWNDKFEDGCKHVCDCKTCWLSWLTCEYEEK